MSASNDGHENGRDDGRDECTELGALVSACADGELEGDELARAEEHLASCEHCRARVEAYRDMDGAAASLAGLGTPEVDDAEWARRRAAVFARPVGATGPSRAGRVIRRIAWTVALAAAAVIILAVFVPGQIGEPPEGEGEGGGGGENVIAEVIEVEPGDDYGVAYQDTGEDGSVAVTFLALGPDE